jgi:predicted small metal-binding protein
MREFKCSDIGKECSWTATAVNDAEILIQAFHHGRLVHDSHDFSEDLQDVVRDHIHDSEPALFESGDNFLLLK